MSKLESNQSLLPHHRLRAYRIATELLDAVLAAKIRDALLREQAHKAAKRACANVAEGAGRVHRADKARSYGIARAEALEAIALTEIAVRAGDARRDALEGVLTKGNELYAILSALIR